MGKKTQAQDSASAVLSNDTIEGVARRFRLLGEPARLRLLRELESGERTVNELTEAVGGTQANISRHLTAMFEGGLLNRRREAGSVYYSIGDPTVFDLCALVCKSTRQYLREQMEAFETRAGR